MATPRLFVASRLVAGTEVAATPGQAHYLGAVMRRSAGNAVLLFNGEDGEWQARITTLHRDRASLVPDRLIRAQLPETDLWLAFGLLKRDATDLVVQKATELGASALLPVVTERSVPTRVNLERLRAIAVEAAEQSERVTVPRVEPPQFLASLLAAWPADRPLFAAVERLASAAVPTIAGPGGLLVGPEGGFTDSELEALRRYPFVRWSSLGSRILRAETACIVGLALLQAPSPG
jgi:16S rRNA (uracil1498-N3)-methyltransferase